MARFAVDDGLLDVNGGLVVDDVGLGAIEDGLDRSRTVVVLINDAVIHDETTSVPTDDTVAHDETRHSYRRCIAIPDDAIAHADATVAHDEATFPLAQSAVDRAERGSLAAGDDHLLARTAGP